MDKHLKKAQLFRFPPEMVAALNAESEKQGVTKTRLLELAWEVFVNLSKPENPVKKQVKRPAKLAGIPDSVLKAAWV